MGGHLQRLGSPPVRNEGTERVDRGQQAQLHTLPRRERPRKADFLRPLDKTNKASLVFSLPHEEGSLSQVLSILYFYKINLTKIQSLPIIGHEWEYMFYVDVTFNDITRYRQSIDAIIPLTKELKVLGEYQDDGKQPNIQHKARLTGSRK